MIFKKVKADRVKSKAKHVRDLTDYIRDPAKTNPGEEVAYAGARGFFSSRHGTQQNEMIAFNKDLALAGASLIIFALIYSGTISADAFGPHIGNISFFNK